MSFAEALTFSTNKEPISKDKHSIGIIVRRSSSYKHVIGICGFIALLCLVRSSYYNHNLSIVALLSPPLGVPEQVQRQWAQYSPWLPTEEYKPPPEGCEITQVNIVRCFILHALSATNQDLAPKARGAIPRFG